MDKWSFNIPLFSRLPEVLDITGTEIARRCGLRQQVLSRYTTNERVVSIQVLINLCNSLRMPIYFLVAENHNFVIPNRESATIPLDYWHPVSWNYEAVDRIFGDGAGRINWKDVAIAMGSSPQKPHERFALRRRFKVTDFFTACNAFDLSPFLFLNDPNRPSLSTSKKRKQSPPPSYAELEQRIGTLERNLADLTQKFNDLFRKHEALEKSVAQVNIQNVSNSHIQNVSNSHISNIGINDHMDMAAEDQPDEH